MANRFRTAIKEKVKSKKSYQHLFPGILLLKASITVHKSTFHGSHIVKAHLCTCKNKAGIHEGYYLLVPKGSLPISEMHKCERQILSLHPYYGLLLNYGL